MALVKATLEEVDKSSNKITVQFNPQTLRVSYRTSGAPGREVPAGTTPQQGVSSMNTGFSASLSLELFFDTSDNGEDVRNTTLRIAEWVAPLQPRTANAQPIVIFLWGKFLFRGHIQSMDETLDLFSEDGTPLRATVSLSMNEVADDKRQAQGSGAGGGSGLGGGLSAGFSAGASAGVGFSAGVSTGVSAGVSAGAGFSAGAAIGTMPLTLAQAGDTLQSLTARAGADWKAVAAANGIDNPRQIQPGTILNLNAGVSGGVQFG